MYLFLQIFTLPVIVYYFNFVPVMGVLYNLLLLPVFTFIMIYGFILLILNSFAHIILIIPFNIYDYILHSLRSVSYTHLYFSTVFSFKSTVLILYLNFFIQLYKSILLNESKTRVMFNCFAFSARKGISKLLPLKVTIYFFNFISSFKYLRASGWSCLY